MQFFYVYKSLAHPEYNNYVTPYTLEERLMHVREAERVIGSRFRWICDGMSNEFKNAMGRAPNAEFVIDPEGKVARRRVWSDPVKLREDLEELIGSVDNPTQLDDLDLPDIAPAGKVARGIVPRVEMPGSMQPLIIEPLDNGKYPYYVKLRAEADPEFLEGESESGKMYLGFHLDPLYHVHWNNEAEPLEFKLTTAAKTSITPATGRAPKIEEPADADPREFLVDIVAADLSTPVDLQVRYFACDDDNTFCVPVTQKYRIHLEGDKEGGSAMGRKIAAGEAPTAERMLASFKEMDRNGDGNLTRDELPGPFKGRFDLMDADGNGFVDDAEMEAAAEQVVKMMGG
ncbi:MAG: hypothetical protein O7A07_05295 [Acidobacteria bacterium]|nr:hypothetical protein [Acidobacteriota bacterium]